MIQRRITDIILGDLKKKMVMIAGPRQCGKTTLAKQIGLRCKKSYHYYNWDIDEDRKDILQGRLDSSSELWILDELHKYRHWKNFLKGKFDQDKGKRSFLITGSAKLDVYSRGGDSLQGRYFFHRLHPFTIAEIAGCKNLAPVEEVLKFHISTKKNTEKTLEDLFVLGGFPEPFLSGSEKEASRWRLAYGSHLVREEIRDLARIQELDKLELLFDRLPQNVGSVLSINSLREDLEVAFETVRDWLLILENTYGIFRIPPFGAVRIKAVKKEQKLYFWDWAKVPEPSARFENMVALHLLRFVHWQRDVEGNDFELRYFRDVNGHEVDFIILKDKKPWCAIEAKMSEQGLDTNLKYLVQRVKIPYAFQVHFKGTKDWGPPKINDCKIRILPAGRFLVNFA